VEQEKACSDAALTGDRGEPRSGKIPWAASEYPLPDAPADRLVVAVRVL
jgi:hypothetical protein